MNRVEEAIFAATYAQNRRLDTSCAAVLEFRKANPQGLGPEGKQLVVEARFCWAPPSRAEAAKRESLVEAQYLEGDRLTEERASEIIQALKDERFIVLSFREYSLIQHSLTPRERSLIGIAK